LTFDLFCFCLENMAEEEDDEVRRLPNETTIAWLERLITIGADAGVRADVRQILAAEQQQAGQLH
jgi:hypothetical protein